MAEKLTEKGLIIGLIPEEEPAKEEVKKAESEPKKKSAKKTEK